MMKNSFSGIAAQGVFQGEVTYANPPVFSFKSSETKVIRQNNRVRILGIQGQTLIILEHKSTDEGLALVPVNYAEIEGSEIPNARGVEGEIEGLSAGSTTLKCTHFNARMKDHQGQDVVFSGDFDLVLTPSN